MSSHPNVILLARLSPDGLTRKTRAAIIAQYPTDEGDPDYVKIGEVSYHTVVLESNYHNDFQINGKKGDILVLDFVTYGYGEEIQFNNLLSQQVELADWCKKVCKDHSCSYQICVTANYW